MSFYTKSKAPLDVPLWALGVDRYTLNKTIIHGQIRRGKYGEEFCFIDSDGDLFCPRLLAATDYIFFDTKEEAESAAPAVAAKMIDELIRLFPCVYGEPFSDYSKEVST